MTLIKQLTEEVKKLKQDFSKNTSETKSSTATNKKGNTEKIKINLRSKAKTRYFNCNLDTNLLNIYKIYFQ